MADEVEVGGIVSGRREELRQNRMGGLGAGARWSQTESAGHTVDVRVDGESGKAQGELKDDGGGLWTDAFESQQPGAGLFRRETGQETQIEIAPFFRDRGKSLLQTRAFLIR
jgi:hypothetical protein